MMVPVQSSDTDGMSTRIADLCAELGACAAGYWRLDSETRTLIQVCFVPGARLDPQVGREFAAATLEVPLSQTSLGIVVAAISGQPAVSHAGRPAGELRLGPLGCGPSARPGRWLFRSATRPGRCAV